MLNDWYASIDPVALQLGGISIRWYGLAYLMGFIIGITLMAHLARRWKLRFGIDEALTVLICVMVGVVVGGRLGYVIFYGAGHYLAHPLEVFALQDGGMSFHGGLIGALMAGCIASKIIKIPFGTLADLAAIVTPCGLCLGRIANFINGELWGAPTDLPWGVVFGGSAGLIPRHPSQLYEAALEGLLLFIILIVVAYRRPPLCRYSYLAIFLMGYGLVRFGIEFVRQPDAQLGYLAFGWLTMGQVLSIPLIVGGISLWFYASKRKCPQVQLRT